jgi:biotin synthase-like enzyme
LLLIAICNVLILKTIVTTNRCNYCFLSFNYDANNAAKPIPSISAAAISIAVWIFPEASG